MCLNPTLHYSCAPTLYSDPYLNGAQADGVINMFSCITRNSLVAGGHPSTVFEASARSRSRSPPSLYAQT
mgnify:CR=1 FL=1